MERALYDPEHGYYARAARRSGRAGDFFTSVDVGPIFGELLELQLAEMYRLLARAEHAESSSLPLIDLVEAGAGNGRLAADILRAMRKRDPDLYGATRLHLVEASAAARNAQRDVLSDVVERVVSSGDELPESFEGVLIANELLDAMPVHQVVMTPDGLREVFVSGDRLDEDEPSTPRLGAYLDALGVRLEPGWRVEINLNAVDWMRDAARRLRRGFMILIDYGHEARALYSVSHSTGTLTTFSGHRSSGPEAASPAWLHDPGEQDITSHVDFTSIRNAAEAEGMTTIALLDQTYFILGLLQANPQSPIGSPSLRTLIMPGGLGSTMKVLILGKGVGDPPLAGCSFSRRLT